MSNYTVDCFKNDFHRFMDLIKKQIEVCPEKLWIKKEGGFYFWQQILHNLACVELYALPFDEPSKQKRYSREVVMLSEEAAEYMSKEEMLLLAEEMTKLADNFMENLSEEKLTARNERMSNALKMERSNLHALIGLIRHMCYHLGCCDTILRYDGIKGVY